MSRGWTRAERLREMERLYVQRAFTDIEMAERLGVDRTTVYRDRLALEAEIPFSADEQGRYRIDRSRYISGIRLNLHEALALYLAARRAARQTRSGQPHAASALEKLSAALRQPMTEKLVRAAGQVSAQPAQPERVRVLETVAQAWVEQRKVRITHRSLRGKRALNYVVSPYLIEPALWSEGAYLIGHSDVHGDLATFKIERIEAAVLLGESFEIPEDFDEQALLRFAWGIWYGDDEPVTVRLRFTPGEAARRLRESIWHPSQSVTETPDGGCVWTAQVAEWLEILPWVRGWGADVEVLEPEGLRQAVAGEAQRLASLYKPVASEPSKNQYFAHSNKDCDEAGWQLLKDHLQSTGKLAYELGRDAEISELAQLAGLVHDIGKYSQAFQNRLRGSKVQVDHATAAAREIMSLFPGNPLSEILSYCLAGHHSGLPDFGDQTDLPGNSTLYARREKKPLEDYSCYKAEIDVKGPLVLPKQLKISPGHPGFTASFLTRMVYSTLVDADWLDTETYMEGKAKPRGGYASLDVLLARLNRHLEQFEGKPGFINQKRQETLRACISQARLDPGLFSLTLPTGGGKTLASLAFALQHAIEHGLKRIIYVIPFTTIIEQNAAIFKEALGEENVLEHHSNFDWELLKTQNSGDDETNQVYEKLKLASENWDIPIVVTTNVQFFESLFSHKKSRARKIHNIARSVMIFDESQMLPREYLQACMLAVGELVQNYGATAVFCTATQPKLDQYFTNLKISELAPDPQALFDFYRRVKIQSIGSLDDSQLCQRLNEYSQVLCVVNTRRHARGIFTSLDENDRFHLSTLMCAAHRQQVMEEVRARLPGGRHCRLVSTQVVEAGVDLDFPVGFRAMAGLDSMIQAAGRVNREGSIPSGDMFIFEPDTTLIKRTPAFIAQTARAGASVLRDYSTDPASLGAVEAYFSLLDSLNDPQQSTDINHILSCLDKEKFDFTKAGERFRLIRSTTIPVIIPYDDTAVDLLSRLRWSTFPARILRELQRYTVNIYEQEYTALQKKGAIDTYQDIYNVLHDLEFYDKHTGLALLEDRAGEAIFFD